MSKMDNTQVEFFNNLDKQIFNRILVTALVLIAMFVMLDLVKHNLYSLISNGATFVLCAIIYVLVRLRHYEVAFWGLFGAMPIVISVNIAIFGNTNIHLLLISGGVIASYLSRKMLYWSEIIWGLVIITFPLNYFLLYKQGKLDSVSDSELIPFFANSFIAVLFAMVASRTFRRLNYELYQSLSLKNNLKTQIISVLSHDLRSPINSLKSLLKMSEEGDLSENQFRYLLQRINSDVSKTSEMLDNTLYWVSNQPITISSFNIRDVLTNTLTLYERQARDKGVELKLNADPNFEVISDKELIKIIIRNLVSNAIKFCRENSGRIDLVVLKSESFFIVSCKDNGSGMTPDQLQNLFSITQSAAGSSGELGTGLGLSIVKAYADLLKIELGVESEINQGTTFNLKMPITLS
ncbi:hypothetical protein GC194_00060 [bacterium]|nr:hypothetical protein [bacterium]